MVFVYCDTISQHRRRRRRRRWRKGSLTFEKCLLTHTLHSVYSKTAKTVLQRSNHNTNNNGTLYEEAFSPFSNFSLRGCTNGLWFVLLVSSIPLLPHLPHSPEKIYEKPTLAVIRLFTAGWLGYRKFEDLHRGGGGFAISCNANFSRWTFLNDLSNIESLSFIDV